MLLENFRLVCLIAAAACALPAPAQSWKPSRPVAFITPSSPAGSLDLTARIGGYLGRNHDPPPGHQLMWRGYARLQAWGEGFALRGE